MTTVPHLSMESLQCLYNYALKRHSVQLQLFIRQELPVVFENIDEEFKKEDGQI